MTILEFAEDLAAEAESLHDSHGQLAVTPPHIITRDRNRNVLGLVFTAVIDGRVVTVSVERV